MKNVKGLIIILIIFVIVIAGSLIFINSKSKNNGNNKEDCISITGGSYRLYFETNGGEAIEPISVCIACAPNSYENIPNVTKEGYTFEGWYYDSNLTEKVDVTNTRDITPIPNLNESGCTIGYKDITLYAKWI